MNKTTKKLLFSISFLTLFCSSLMHLEAKDAKYKWCTLQDSFTFYNQDTAANQQQDITLWYAVNTDETCASKEIPQELMCSRHTPEQFKTTNSAGGAFLNKPISTDIEEVSLVSFDGYNRKDVFKPRFSPTDKIHCFQL